MEEQPMKHYALYEHDYIRTTNVDDDYAADESGDECSSNGTGIAGAIVHAVKDPLGVVNEVNTEVRSEAEEAAWYNLSKLGTDNGFIILL
jgi:hypothetical protein